MVTQYQTALHIFQGLLGFNRVHASIWTELNEFFKWQVYLLSAHSISKILVFEIPKYNSQYNHTFQMQLTEQRIVAHYLIEAERHIYTSIIE